MNIEMETKQSLKTLNIFNALNFKSNAFARVSLILKTSFAAPRSEKPFQPLGKCTAAKKVLFIFN